jgi:hypothetical protein
MTIVGWKDIAELIGIGAIVASLIFVGMEMRQAQRIAIAAQYHERAALAVEWFYERSDNPSFLAEQCFPELSADLTPQRAGEICVALHSFMTISDNHLYQYQAGFLDEESWSARRNGIKFAFRNPAARYLIFEGNDAYRDSFVELARTLVAEIEDEKPK